LQRGCQVIHERAEADALHDAANFDRPALHDVLSALSPPRWEDQRP
jgi:hypothetical protein